MIFNILQSMTPSGISGIKIVESINNFLISLSGCRLSFLKPKGAECRFAYSECNIALSSQYISVSASYLLCPLPPTFNSIGNKIL